MSNTLMQLGVIIKKNFKRLISSKISASMVVFGPLVLILLMGVAFQSSGFHGVTVTTYSDEYTDISEEIIKTMQDSDFKLYKAKSHEDCVEQVKQGISHLCMTFPTNFEQEKMEFYVDYSRMNLVYAVISKITKQVQQLSSDISLGMTQDLLNFIKASSTKLDESSIILTQIETDAGLMQQTLFQMKASMDGINVQEGLSGISELTNNQSQTNTQINSLKTTIGTLQASLILAKQDLLTTNQQLKDQQTTISQSMTQMSCTAQNSNDLSAHFGSPTFNAVLIADPNPTCSILYTLKLSLDEQVIKSATTAAQVETMSTYLTQMGSQVNSFQANLKSQATSAETSVKNLDAIKQNTSEELIKTATAATQSTQTLKAMTQNLNELKQQFNKISSTDANQVIKPIKTKIKSLTTQKINTLEILFPALIVMVILFEGILLGNTLVMREKKTKAFFRNQILPINNFLFVAGSYITTIILALIQVLIVILIGTLIFNVNLHFDWLTLLPLLILSILIFSSIGMLIGYLFKSEETAVLVAVILAVMLLLFSNLIIPIETMEATVGAIAHFTPFNLAEELLRRSMVFGGSIGSLNPLTIIIFLVELIILAFITIILHKKTFNKAA